MNYYEIYKTAREKRDLETMVKNDAIFVWMTFANNKDLLKAIEDAANRVLRERGWDLRE